MTAMMSAMNSMNTTAEDWSTDIYVPYRALTKIYGRSEETFFQTCAPLARSLSFMYRPAIISSDVREI